MINKLTPDILKNISEKYGPAFYLADSHRFQQNFHDLHHCFSSLYQPFSLAYSYKTNYLPHFCQLVDSLGGYSEVVSPMELQLALKIGVPYEKIIWNGPVKPKDDLTDFLIKGGQANIDNLQEAELVTKIAQAYPEKFLKIGIRCNFDIGDKNVSRFGIDAPSAEFYKCLQLLQKYSNIQLFSLHCHFSPRNFKTWQARVSGMLEIIKTYQLTPQRLDFGGSLFGRMSEQTKIQYKAEIPSWEDYAKAITTPLKRFFYDRPIMPELVLEPGSALVSDALFFATKVLNIKQIRNKFIATLMGTYYNLPQSLSRKNLPVTIIPMGEKQENYNDLDMGGFTCIDFDYLYRHYSGPLAINDFVIFHEAGAYSLVLRPPFIMPNVPVIEINNDNIMLLKQNDSFDDIFKNYIFT